MNTTKRILTALLALVVLFGVMGCEAIDGFSYTNTPWGMLDNPVDEENIFPVTSVSLGQTTLVIIAGETGALTASISPANASNKVIIWSSSDDTVATVNSSGVLTGVAPGTADISVKTDDGGYEAYCTVTVLDSIANTMVSITGGTFNNGTANVTVSSFNMSKYEVSQAQYIAVMGSNPSWNTSANGYTHDLSLPVEQVSWYDALVFCNKLSVLEGKTLVYAISGSTNPDDWGTVPTSSDATWNEVIMDMAANGYRMPMEAEWEFAARGGNSTNGYTYAGSNTFDDVAWFWDNSGSTTHTVGTKLPNELGLYDMSGNVEEWCQDWYGSYSSSAQTDPVGASSGSNRILRGSSWSISATSCTARSSYYPYARDFAFGFRLASR